MMSATHPPPAQNRIGQERMKTMSNTDNAIRNDMNVAGLHKHSTTSTSSSANSTEVSGVPSPASNNSNARMNPSSQQVTRVPRKKRIFKVIIIGDAGVGKTCLSFRYCNGRFPERTEATIGVDFRERGVNLDGENIRVQLWDTAGQERFRQSMTSHYYRNVHAVVFVYDMTKPRSFQSLPGWIEECKKNTDSPSQLPMILIGNKCDMKDETQVSTHQAQRFADKHDMPLFETSAKTDSEMDHVDAIFMTLVHKLKDRKEIHVQSEQERAEINTGNKILRAADLMNEQAEDTGGYCGC